MASAKHKKICLFSRALSLVLFLLLLCFLFVIWASVSFGWFSKNTNVTVDGVSVQTAGQTNLEIRATASGEDISVSELVSDMTTLGTPETEIGFYPGVSGSFSFFVSDGTAGEQDYDFLFHATVTNNSFHVCSPETGDNYSEGFYPEATAEQREIAVRYLSSHILFFTSYENGLYSGWLNPDTPSTLRASGTGASKVTVYWVWVGEHAQIFDGSIPDSERLIAEETRAEIAGYYASRMDTVTENGENSREAFNNADMLIGLTIKYLRFDISVAKL